MKKILLIILLFTSAIASAQDGNLGLLKRISTRVDLFTDIWQVKNDSIKPGSINPGISFFLMLDNPMGEGPKTPWSWAIGAGLTSENLYNNVLIGYKANSSNVYETYFYRIPKTTATGSALSYKKDKMVYTFLDFPFEIRYKTDNGFKFAAGLKYGISLGFHLKYKGDDPAGKLGYVKIKESTSTNLETNRYGVTFAVGYKSIMFNGFYQLSKTYKDNVGPEMYPISLGISLHPFK
ncbi:MAG: hypothetical protein Q8908_10095 [Bacteroidota bacterium]|nr:hypothetical protein [Bacteroidota bacterium]